MADTSGQYAVYLKLTGLPAGAAEEVREEIEAALSREVPGGSVTAVSVTEERPSPDRDAVEEHIVALRVLYCTLPAEFQRADTLATLAEHYHRELAYLWRSMRGGRCVRGVIDLRPWRQAGTQWICEFASYDLGAPYGNEFNFHGQNTSQWQNRETGWAGHQGAIVLDTADGQISSHH